MQAPLLIAFNLNDDVNVFPHPYKIFLFKLLLRVAYKTLVRRLRKICAITIQQILPPYGDFAAGVTAVWICHGNYGED